MQRRRALACLIIFGIIPLAALGDEGSGRDRREGLKASERAEFGGRWLSHKDRGWDRESLLRLKQQDPEKFNKVIEERRQSVQERLEYLRQHNPKEYERAQAQIRNKRRQRLERLRAQDPEAFEKTLEKRRARFRERLEKAKKENPEQYERIMRQRQRREGSGAQAQ
jgi:hypothetical protein